MSLSPPTFRSIDFERLLNNDLNNDPNNDPASFNINFSLPESDFHYIIKGSCRGFIFMFHHENFYLWNPCTGFKKEIPLSPFASKLGADRYNHFDGFGYDQSRDDYLIVVMSPVSTAANRYEYDELSDDYQVSLHLEFFSFRNNTWKEIEGNDFPYTVVDSQWWLLNGAIHWFSNDVRMNAIVVFDLTERKLLDIKLPDGFNLVPDCCDLWVFGEFLSLWTMDYFNGRVEIWVMKEYKVHSSWTKTLVLPLYPAANHYLYPMCCTKNGDIIGRNGSSRLVKYNDKGEVLGHRSFSNSPSEDVVMYTESLLSLPGDNEQV
jgi:F-box interacting protein